MAEQSTPTLTSILEYLHLTLRYVASGFVAVGVYIFLYNPVITEFKDLSAFLVFITATIGIITYGLHFATLDKIFYGWSIIHYLKGNRNHIPSILTTQIVDWQKAKGNQEFKAEDILDSLDKTFFFQMPKNNIAKATINLFLIHPKIKSFFRNKTFLGLKSNTKLKRYLLFALANQTYLRSISKNELLVGIQNQVEKRLALLNFLYCSFYQIVTITLYYIIIKMTSSDTILLHEKIKLLILFIISGFILFSAVRFNRRICSREMWLIENFKQEVIDVNKQMEKTSANTGIANSEAGH